MLERTAPSEGAFSPLLADAQHGGSVGRHRFKIMMPISKSLLHEESQLKVLQLLDANPDMSQRDVAGHLGVSLGKANYCIKALVDKGMIKMQNFRNSQNKLAYAYLLTPAGLAAKADLTARYLKIKMSEYESLKREIIELKRETSDYKANEP